MKEFENIMLDLKRKIFRPVYFLCGEEPYYIDTITDFIEANVLDEAEREFNQTIVYGKETSLGGILGLARQYPMMSEYRVVIVKEAQDVRDLSRKSDSDETADENSAPALKQFQSYVQKPQPSTILVFAYKYKTFDKRTALAKSLQKHAVFLETKKLYENQLPQWISNLVKERGYAMNQRASFMMAEFLGNDLSRIANELDKLTITLKAGAEITPEMVQEKIGVSKEYNVFELQDALSKRDVLKANRIVNYFASNEKDHPLIMVLGNLYGYFCKILKYHFLPDKSKFAAAQGLGVNPFFVEGYAIAASNYPTGKLKQVFGFLKECDLRSKGIDNPSVGQGELLKELVFKILH
jgi:DNA polymerase III subunit delta